MGENNQGFLKASDVQPQKQAHNHRVFIGHLAARPLQAALLVVAMVALGFGVLAMPGKRVWFPAALAFAGAAYLAVATLRARGRPRSPPPS